MLSDRDSDCWSVPRSGNSIIGKWRALNKKEKIRYIYVDLEEYELCVGRLQDKATVWQDAHVTHRRVPPPTPPPPSPTQALSLSHTSPHCVAERASIIVPKASSPPFAAA